MVEFPRAAVVIRAITIPRLLAGPQTSTSGYAGGCRRVSRTEQGPLFHERIDIRGVNEPPIVLIARTMRICTEGITSVLVGHDEYNIGSIWHGGVSTGAIKPFLTSASTNLIGRCNPPRLGTVNRCVFCDHSTKGLDTGFEPLVYEFAVLKGARGASDPHLVREAPSVNGPNASS